MRVQYRTSQPLPATTGRKYAYDANDASSRHSDVSESTVKAPCDSSDTTEYIPAAAHAFSPAIPNTADDVDPLLPFEKLLPWNVGSFIFFQTNKRIRLLSVCFWKEI